ncbi:unnamed protein product [Chilo suppressalis]|uniref:DUF3730 domain-containing protein n=2 Tax=Chilo suppressalis TaxID=168631 RepID=A0ABN8B378_CHISP|nr:unnamed protein product [Chilo suppressalis]
MNEIEYKLKTNSSILIVNAIDKLISAIKSKFKIGERQRFVLENEELKFLREKCSAKETVVSLTACQGLLALVELGVLEIAHTMSTIVTLLPSAHNYSAIISTMAGLLILDLRSRLVPGQPYKCQFTLKSPQHPFITVLEKNKEAEDDVLAQMHALCNHPDYIVSSNSLELLRSVFLWLTCNPRQVATSASNLRPWQLLLSLPQSTAQSSLLLSCLSYQQFCNPKLTERAFAAYSAVTDAAIYRQDREYVTALLPILARISNELVRHGRDPRSCYSLLERCLALDATEIRHATGITLALLADNLQHTSALYLHELFNLALNIISKYENTKTSLNSFVALSLQWLHMPSYLTTSALKVASKIVDIYQTATKDDASFHTPNLKANKIFETLLYTDRRLFVEFKLLENWERVRDNPDKLKSWLDTIGSLDDYVKLDLVPFLIGVAMEKRSEDWYEDVVIRALEMVVAVVDAKKELSVMLMPVLLYKIANDSSSNVRMHCLRALPLMAKTKENVPAIVAILNKLKAGKGVPVSFLIMLYTSLAETQVRCFPYLQEVLVESCGRPDEPKWELDVARAFAIVRVCEVRASTHGLELVSSISSILNRCTDKPGSSATGLCLLALRHLWRASAVAPPGTWRALQPRLARDNRPHVKISICKLLSEVPALRVSTPEYDKLISDAANHLWGYVATSNEPEVVEAACEALANFKVDDYKLKDIPDVYRKTVKLPAAYCKTPADAARKPEDVLEYVPYEVWPEVYKYTNQAALAGVQRMVAKLIEREVRGYRSGVYQPDAKGEPQGLGYLPSASVIRGLVECFRKQVTSPSYDFPDIVLLSILHTLTEEYPKPIPPVDLCFLHELFHRGSQWTGGCLRLAARQAQTSGSARRLLENYLQGIVPGTTSEADILQMFEILPILCRGMPPNSLRGPLERCLSSAYEAVANLKQQDLVEGQEPLFVRQLRAVKDSLESEKTHDANRTLLSQFMENYFIVIPDDNIAWPAYVETCQALSTKYLERMTSPSSWWEVTSEALRKSCAVRSKLGSLVWLHEIIDAVATQITEQQFSLECMSPALQKAVVDDTSTRDWFLQLMARTQAAFKETEEMSAKLYLLDVFTLSVIIFSGHWTLDTSYLTSRDTRNHLCPAACCDLLERPLWTDIQPKMIEWVRHTSQSVEDGGVCGRTLLALSHWQHFGRAFLHLDGFFAIDTTRVED